MSESIPSLEEPCSERCCTLWRWYKTWIYGCLIILAVCGAIVASILSKTSVNYPCIQYGSTTLASDVSTDCLQYVWNQNCKTPYSFAGYKGWWNSSPQGTYMVRCTQQPCGVGSYGNICIYMGLCLIGYGQ